MNPNPPSNLGNAPRPSRLAKWRRFDVGRIQVSFAFGRFRIGYHDMGDGDGQVSLGFLLFYWIWRTRAAVEAG